MLKSIISSNIKIKSYDPNNLKKLLDLEVNRHKYDRSESKITIDEKNHILEINIFTKDLIAYKATVNNYINLLELIKKASEVEL
jgi:tRNA threonylcarbamoyladenosine modification (KEOPS) complex  Pcc1 subunit